MSAAAYGVGIDGDPLGWHTDGHERPSTAECTTRLATGADGAPGGRPAGGRARDGGAGRDG
ncbi:MAG: hypothetical protein B7X40_03060 [Cellulomonas sp. 14-74-6]|nr:MAG: hypothetical protein B7X40_03060 [Cellulomonas sp. 14-74-6]